MRNHMNYTRVSILQTLFDIDKPCTEEEIRLKWMQTADIEYVKHIEAVPDPDFAKIGVNMVFRAALVDLKRNEQVFFDAKEGTFSFKRKPEMNSLDSDWQG